MPLEELPSGVSELEARVYQLEARVGRLERMIETLSGTARDRRLAALTTGQTTPQPAPIGPRAVPTAHPPARAAQGAVSTSIPIHPVRRGPQR